MEKLTKELFIEGFCGEGNSRYVSTDSVLTKKILESISGITDIEFEEQSTHYWYSFHYRGRKLSIGGAQGHEGDDMELYVCDYEHGVGLSDCEGCLVMWCSGSEMINEFNKWYSDSCRVIKGRDNNINW